MIKVRSKTLFISGEEQSIAAVGEAETTVREFSIDRLSGDGIDLANLIFKLNIRYVGTKQSDRSDLEKIVTDDSIILRWLISSVTLSHPGTAFIQLDAFDREGSCRWKSYQAAVYIEKSLDSVVVSRSTLSELEQLEKKFETIGVGEAARVEAEKKRIVAEEKREEAEGKRNQSLANIVSEEEKIKAVSEEVKGYRDSIKEDKEAVSRDKKDVVSVRSEVISAMNTAQQYASSAESSKAEATTARNEAVNAKTEANNAKNEAISAKNAANSIKGEVQALKNEANSTVDRAKQNADRAESFANNAKVSEGKAEGFKTEASVSAQKAKDSEAKTLEALKKAEASGKVSITKEEMKTYVDSAVGNVKSGITEAEATTLARKVANDSITSRFADGKGTIESDVKKWSQDPSAELNIDATSVIPGYFFKNSLSGFRSGMWDIHAKGLMELRNVEKSLYSTQRDLLTFLNRGNALETFKEIKSLVKSNQHDQLKVGDYIVDNNIKWIVASIDRLGEKRSVEFLTFDFPDTLSLESENLKNKVFTLKDFDIEISKICNNTEATSRLAREGIPSKTILYYGEGTYETMYYVPYHESVDAINVLGATITIANLLDKEFTTNVDATNIPLFNLEIFKRKLYASAYLLRLGNGFGSYSVTKGVHPNPGDFNSKVSPDKRSKLPKPIICFRIEGN
jgi:merozoite surface protein 3 (MSP3), putative|nr:MAG TPA: hypothetical protein [Caudoviricetes sp.]